MRALTSFLNFVLSGAVLESARPFFFGANLVALKKKDGGISPIAVGNTLRRLGAKCAGLLVREEMAELLAPIQLGYGIKRGSEAAVHGARLFLKALQNNEVLLKLDFMNAFNTIGEIRC